MLKIDYKKRSSKLFTTEMLVIEDFDGKQLSHYSRFDFKKKIMHLDSFMQNIRAIQYSPFIHVKI